MRILSTLFSALILLVGCTAGDTPNDSETEEVFEKGYRPVRDGLYRDNAGNLYFKTIDNSNPEEARDRYLNTVWYADSAREMIRVIDVPTFHHFGGDYYGDRRYVYHFFKMSDGGSLSVLEGSHPESFEVFDSSLYAMDEHSAYFRGKRLEGADIATFEPINTNGDPWPTGWFAKDQNCYYEYGERVSKEEASEKGFNF